MENLTANYDLKKILLGSNYIDDGNPIKNFLLARDDKNYRDKSDDYFNYKNFKRGHIENYQLIENVFRTLFPNLNSDYKDIANSFFITYKCYLQIMYPKIFMPNGTVKKGDVSPLTIPIYEEENPTPNIRYAPFVSEEYEVIHEKYLTYYKNHFPFLKVHKGMKWVEFLTINFEFFSKVHNLEELQRFAVLTHTIGNIVTVPKGFNAGRKHYDYWDWGLKLLQGGSLEPIGEWRDFVNTYYLSCYVDTEYEIIPYWENHLASNIHLLPKDEFDIIRFLEHVNFCIEKRGENMMNDFNKKME
ncbi:hypothetical protein D1B31_18150 [Neobacillus notoginsengisoli]|uniref:Uncharacterized protein n=1 Tax=Neobacillus notoginsengisoli TaxID=1578198 RepID=A0A417YQJ0_9BACI|nr:hypothetical protein [Neobacillus notoginsengisoli]RHW36011.1 hypothetical protein D1B31_18150 [Neobacillus notoginsengisoli]